MKKKVPIMIFCFFIIAATVAANWGIQVYAQAKEGDTETEDGTKDSISRTYAKILSITGNQMTYLILEEETDQVVTDETEREASIQNMQNQEFSGQRPGESGVGTDERPSGSGGMPQGMPSGNMPESGRSDERPSGRGSMPQGMPSGNMSESEGTDERPSGSGSMPQGEDTGDRPDRTASRENAAERTQTVYVPVSAPVYTDTGKQKTFSILQAGDSITIESEPGSTGEDVITAIYLTATED